MVGVVSEVKYDGLDQPDQGTVYLPISGGTFRFLIVRSGGDPLSIAPAVRQAVRELEPAAPLSNVATVASLVDQSLLRPAVAVDAGRQLRGVALLLSVIGIYGVMGYYVQQHLKEISIRMALGGSRGDVARLVVGQGMMVVAVGVIAGSGAGVCRDAIDVEPVVWRRRHRSARVHRRRGADADGGAAGVRGAGLARDARAAGGGLEERIGIGPKLCASRSFSTRTRRRIFPDGDFGIASTNATCLTHL